MCMQWRHAKDDECFTNLRYILQVIRFTILLCKYFSWFLVQIISQGSLHSDVVEMNTFM